MLKAIYLEGRIKLTIRPDGPILIKAGETGGADPTRPDMEFVRSKSVRGEIYIPGPSIKGVVRAQAERICRTIDRDGRNPEQDDPPLADNPLGKEGKYKNVEDNNFSSGVYFQREDVKKSLEIEPQRTAVIYRRSAFTARLFGHTSLAGRVRFADAYGQDVLIEERNGVAIDRVYGSVAVGPFNYETVVGGAFPTTIDFRNMTLAQLGLLGLALRDLAAGRVALGFGKSRGLGHVKASFDGMELRYPTCMRRGDKLLLLNGHEVSDLSQLAGLGVFPAGEAYHLPEKDVTTLPDGLLYTDDTDTGLGVKLETSDGEHVKAIFRACMDAWKQAIGWAA
jgi:CRISPR/Cas system CSM-associated protein Csm3 (group 7 of RAMP superfamily)